MIKTNINEAIARIDDWKGKNVTYELVPGGITNPNYKVFVDGTPYFLKIPGAGTDFIDRDNCHAANMIASDSGVGAKVEYFFPDTAVEVFEWLDGYRTTSVGDMFNEKICLAGIRAIKEFHNLPGATLPLEESLFDQCREMVERARMGDYLPPWHTKMMWLMDRIENAFNAIGIEKKPCHNDYWYSNFMWDDENEVGKIIDLEYASMNDPMYDVALYMTICSGTDDMDKEAVKAYNDGVFDDVLYARLKLNRIAGDIKWAYWALMQAVTSNVGVDYFDWYAGKLNRLQYMFADPRIDSWLNLLEGRPIWRIPDAWKYE